MYAVCVSAGHEPTNTRDHDDSARCSRTRDWIDQASGPEDDEEDEFEDEAETCKGLWRQTHIEEWPLG
jgi:hypothetical protein